MDSSAYNSVNVEKDCNALGGLFQQIINDMKVSLKEKLKNETNRNDYSL